MTRPGARHGDEPHNKYTVEDVQRWRQQWRKGMTLPQIATENNVSITTITRWMSKEARGEL